MYITYCYIWSLEKISWRCEINTKKKISNLALLEFLNKLCSKGTDQTEKEKKLFKYPGEQHQFHKLKLHKTESHTI